jgi:membrane-associated phospholipid phosphatase
MTRKNPKRRTLRVKSGLRNLIQNHAPEEQPFLAFRLGRFFYATDIYILTALAIYTLIAIFYFYQVRYASALIYQNVFLAVAIISIAVVSGLRAGKFFHIVHRFYFPPVVYLLFQQIFYYIPVVNPHDYDNVLKNWDYTLLGLYPTQWMMRFANPWLTELMQLSYVLFFFHAFAQGIEMYIRKKEFELDYLARKVVLGFLLSYLLYLAMPAIGPRFTLHDFSRINIELPGIFSTEYFRSLIDAGDGITYSGINPAIEVHRNCMPSGHTMMTVMNIIIAFRLRSRLRWAFVVLGISLIFSTIYLRYHYFVDLLAGCILAFFVLWAEPHFHAWMQKKGWIHQAEHKS